MLDQALQEISDLFLQPNVLRSMAILAFSFIIAFYLSKLLAHFLVKVTRIIAQLSDNSPSPAKTFKLRRLETFLSVLIAAIRVFIVVFVTYILWRTLSPASNPGIAAIGASAVFIVLASGTIGPLLRDITTGTAMITERWYNVGDFVRVEPFMDVSGVVERVTLRSTKLRSLNGEVIWMHNQHMQAVKVTPNGVRTIDVDLLVSDPKAAQIIIERAIKSIPKSTMTVAGGLKVINKTQWDDELWMFTIRGKTAPGREWLLDNYFVKALQKYDKELTKGKTLVHDPMIRFADPSMEKSFRRAIRAKD